MKVLWIEDDPVWQKAIESMMLHRSRARKREMIVIARSMLEAERCLRLEKFDVVIVDLGLPDTIDGMASIIRARSAGAGRFAVLSADPNAEAIVAALSRQLDDSFIGTFAKTGQLLSWMLHRPIQALEQWLPFAAAPTPPDAKVA
jgi:DNA-binding response OmpR family regulator